ncbi:MAG: archaeosortase/exosortase family protein [Phycisphaerae bacterium]|nr:archaeosortase/exosortase family protein [Phycisphaerae bacterium]
MGKRRGKTKKHKPAKRLPAGAGGTQAGIGTRIARREEREQGKWSGARSWIAAKLPILRFVLIFGVLMGLFYAVFYRALTPDSAGAGALTWQLDAYAWAAGAVLELFGEEITVTGQVIRSPVFSLRIVRGCDAMEVTALFVCAALALPVPAWRRLAGAAGGILALAIINLVRIVSLYYVGVHCSHDTFDTMHFGVWQALIVVSAILLWVTWAWWATRSWKVPAHVPA